MERYTIGQIARMAAVNVETVRFYERRGLIPEPPRLASGYRQYPSDTVRRIRFIQHAKDLGFSLGEISELLSLRLDPRTSCSDIKGRAEEKIASIQGKINTLERMREVLSALSGACKGRGPVGECPILGALDSPERDSVSSGKEADHGRKKKD